MNSENTLFKGANAVFDQMSFWLVIGVLMIFLAGAAFGRMTDAQPTNSFDTVSRSVAHHHTTYGRFGELHWLQ